MKKRRYQDSTESEPESDFETAALQSAKSTTESDNRQHVSDESDCNLHDSEPEASSNEEEHLSKNLVSDDDSSPEDVSFNASKMSALEKIKQAMKQIESEKEKKKSKRKKLQEKYKQQKKMKLKNNPDECKLPDNFFENLSEEFLKKKYQATEKSEKIAPDSVESEGSSSDELPANEDDDYIPLTMNKIAGVNVRVIREEEKNVKIISQSAFDFKHNMLYGGRNKREPTKVRLAKLQKKMANRR